MDKRFKLLPTEMQQAIQVLQELHNVPDEMALPVVLGTVNLAVQCHYDVDSIMYGVRPTSLFLLSLAPTGALKSTLMREISSGITKFRDEMKILLKDEKLRYELEDKKFTAAKNKWLKDSEQDPYATLPEQPKLIETFDYCVSKGTLNGLIDILKSQSFLGLFSSEAGEFFAGHAFQGKNTGQGIEMCLALTKMWDGDIIEKNTGMERTRLWNRRVMMLFLLQTEVVQEVLNNKLFSEQGFIHRILITQSEKFDKLDWDLSDEAEIKIRKIREKLEPFNEKIYRILRQPLQLVNNKDFELQPTIIEQSEDAKLILGNFYNENKDRSKQDLKKYAGFAERLHEHTLRIAGTLAAFDVTIDSDNSINQKQIKILPQHALAAIDLIDFFCEQRIKMEIGIQDLNPVQTQGCEDLWIWLKDHNWKDRGINDLSRHGPSWFRKLGVKQRHDIIQDLINDDRLIAEETAARNGKKTFILSIVEDKIENSVANISDESCKVAAK